MVSPACCLLSSIIRVSPAGRGITRLSPSCRAIVYSRTSWRSTTPTWWTYRHVDKQVRMKKVGETSWGQTQLYSSMSLEGYWILLRLSEVTWTLCMLGPIRMVTNDDAWYTNITNVRWYPAATLPFINTNSLLHRRQGDCVCLQHSCFYSL